MNSYLRETIGEKLKPIVEQHLLVSTNIDATNSIKGNFHHALYVIFLSQHLTFY